MTRVVRASDGSPRPGDEVLDLAEARGRLRPRRVLNPASHAFDVGAALDVAFG
jgi:hypothetical protein